jgi:solute carrier family 25 phosphate transporter 23/24/25/41
MLLQVSSKGGAGTQLAKLWKEDGIVGFWRGNMAACVRLGPQSAIKFFAFEELQRRVGNGKPLAGWQRTVCGATAGVVSQVLTYPLDVVRTRITIDPKKYSSIFGSIGTIVSEEGPQALYSGIVPTIVGVIPYEGGKFYAFGGIKNFYEAKVGPASPWATCMIGAAAEGFAQIFSYPFEVVRKRSMLNDDKGKPLYDGMVDGFTKILTREGLPGFYRGFWVSLVKGAPFAALQFTFVEEFTKALVRFKTAKAVPPPAASKAPVPVKKGCQGCKK